MAKKKTFREDPQAYLKDQLAGFAKDDATLTDEELNRKLDLLRQLAQDQTAYLPATAGPVVDVIGPGGATLQPINLTEIQQIQKGIDTSEDVKMLEDLLGQRRAKAEREDALNTFIEDIPNQLRRTREDYLSGLADRKVEEFNESVPMIQQTANQRGALYSGDVGDMLTSRAYDLQGQLDQARAQLEAEDNQFFYDAAYQQKVRKLVESNENYRAALDTERQSIRTGQEQRFQGAQANLNRISDIQNADQQYRAQLNAQEIRLKRQRDQEDAQRRSGLISSIGSTVGAVAGAKFGPAGSMAGAQIGSQAGQLG